jgi:hydroxypyruvate isomerase
MPKFSANLTLLFTEVDFMERFARAARAGFKAVEYMFPYPYAADQFLKNWRKTVCSRSFSICRPAIG